MPESYRRQISKDVALEQSKVRERARWRPLVDLEFAFSPRRTMRTEELGEIRKGLRARQLVLLCPCMLAFFTMPPHRLSLPTASHFLRSPWGSPFASLAQTATNPNMTSKPLSLVLIFPLSSISTQRRVF